MDRNGDQNGLGDPERVRNRGTDPDFPDMPEYQRGVNLETIIMTMTTRRCTKKQTIDTTTATISSPTYIVTSINGRFDVIWCSAGVSLEHWVYCVDALSLRA